MRNHGHRALLSVATAIAVLALTFGAEAQVTAEQQSAIRANCRSDFMAKCSGVTPGGKEALVCLQQNISGLSAACKSAVSATLPPPAAATPAAPKAVEAAPAPAPAAPPAPQPAAAPPAPAPAAPPKAAVAAAPKAAAAVATAPTAAQQNSIKQACRSDFMAKCSGVTPGGKDALACLQKNASTLSPACKQAVAAIGGAPATATVAAPAAAAAAATPAAGPTPEQLKAVKFTCRGDFTRYCRGVQPGGPEAIGCLQSNAARLTPDCKTSLADIADSMPAATAAAPAAAAATPAAERRPLPPGITPAGRILRRVMERNQQ